MRRFIKCAAHITLYFVIIGFWKSSPQIHPTTPHLMRITITNPVWLTTIILSLELHIPHYRVRMSGFITRCWKFVMNFGLQWSLQNIAKLKSSIEHVLSVHCNKRGAENVKARKNTKCWCKCFFGWFSPQKLKISESNIWQKTWTINVVHKQQHPTSVQMFWHAFQKIMKTISTKNLNHRHLNSLPLTTESQGLKRFPHQILLRGHGWFCPSHPRPPSPPGAAGPRNRGRCGLPSAAVFGLGTGGPEAKPRAEPNGTKGRKFGESCWCLKSRSFGNFGHSKILPELQEHCAFEDVLMTSSWLKRQCEAGWQSKCFAET